MSAFFWNAGHLGWGIFALAVFTALWLLGADLVWRLKTVSIRRLGPAVIAGWLLGAALVVWVYWWCGR